MARDASLFYSRDTIRRDYLHDKDPDGEEIKFLSEQAEKVDEVLFLYRRARKLIEPVKMGDKPSIQNKIEAYLLAQRIQTIIKQRNAMGQLSPIEGNKFAEVQAETKTKPEPTETKEGAGGKTAQRRSMLTTATEEATEETENG